MWSEVLALKERTEAFDEGWIRGYQEGAAALGGLMGMAEAIANRFWLGPCEDCGSTEDRLVYSQEAGMLLCGACEDV